MKKQLMIFGLLTVIIASFSVVVMNLFVEEDDGYRSARERAWIKKFDKDGDGKLSKEEREAAKKMKREMRDAFSKKRRGEKK